MCTCHRLFPILEQHTNLHAKLMGDSPQGPHTDQRRTFCRAQEPGAARLRPVDRQLGRAAAAAGLQPALVHAAASENRYSMVRLHVAEE